jgi:hypothetical protein
MRAAEPADVPGHDLRRLFDEQGMIKPPKEWPEDLGSTLGLFEERVNMTTRLLVEKHLCPEVSEGQLRERQRPPECLPSPRASTPR